LFAEEQVSMVQQQLWIVRGALNTAEVAVGVAVGVAAAAAEMT